MTGRQTERQTDRHTDTYRLIKARGTSRRLCLLSVIMEIGRPICKSAGQSVVGRLASQFANWPDWQVGRNRDTTSKAVINAALLVVKLG